MNERVVIVTGARDWTAVCPILFAIKRERPTLVVQGGAKGADRIARAVAFVLGIRRRTFHANWAKHKRRAGPIRNGEMLRAYPHARVLAFPLGGPGTADCIRQARELRMNVLVFGP